MLFIPVFAKTDTRHLFCRPTLLPAAMAHSGALSPAPSRLWAHRWRDESPETSAFSNILALRTQRRILIVINLSALHIS